MHRAHLAQLLKLCCQNIGKGRSVGRVEEDELLNVLGVLAGKGRRNDASPVVRDDKRLLAAAAKLEDDLAHILIERLGGVALDVLRLVRVVVAAHVERDDVVLRVERGDLGVPHVPELGEAVDEQEQRVGRTATLDVVQLDAALRLKRAVRAPLGIVQLCPDYSHMRCCRCCCL